MTDRGEGERGRNRLADGESDWWYAETIQSIAMTREASAGHGPAPSAAHHRGVRAPASA